VVPGLFQGTGEVGLVDDVPTRQGPRQVSGGPFRPIYDDDPRSFSHFGSPCPSDDTRVALNHKSRAPAEQGSRRALRYCTRPPERLPCEAGRV
jgi:hypothetical protein